jgi:hypothetical protein
MRQKVLSKKSYEKIRSPDCFLMIITTIYIQMTVFGGTKYEKGTNGTKYENCRRALVCHPLPQMSNSHKENSRLRKSVFRAMVLFYFHGNQQRNPSTFGCYLKRGMQHNLRSSFFDDNNL